MSACTGSTSPPPPTVDPTGGPTSDTSGVALYLAGGSVTDATLADLPDGTLTTVRGLAGGAPPSAAFIDAIDGVESSDGSTTSRPFPLNASQAYDAVITVALASAAAGSTGGTAIAATMTSVTTDGTICTEPGPCLDLLAGGQDIDYDGQSGPIAFDPWGDPSLTRVSTLRYAADNSIRADAITGSPVLEVPPPPGIPDPLPSSSPTGTPEGDGAPLRIGTLISTPGTPDASAQLAGIELAIQELDDAGGILGADVELVQGDPGNDAVAAAQQLIDAGVDAVIGTGPTAEALPVVDLLTSAGIVVVSPTDSSNDLTTAPDRGLFFSTATPDVVGGPAVADLVLTDGHTRVALLARDDAADVALATATSTAVASSEIPVVPDQVISFSADGQDLVDAVTQVRTATPDAIVLIAGDDTGLVIDELLRQGIVLGQPSRSASPDP